VAGIERVGDAVEGVGQEAQDAGRGAGELGDGLDDIAVALANIATVEGLRRLATDLVRASASAQTLQASLAYAVGSEKEAGRVYREILGTFGPLGLDVAALTDNFVRLKNLGLDASTRALRAYTNVAKGSRKETTDFVEAVADATVGEFERLKEFGIKASVQGNQVALTFRGTTRSVANDAASIEQALISIGEVEFGGAIEAQAQTVEAQVARLEASWERLKATFGAGLAEGVGETSQALAELVEVAAEDSRALAELSARDRQFLEQTRAWGQGIGITSDAIDRLTFRHNHLADALGEVTAAIGDAKRLDLPAEQFERLATLQGEVRDQIAATLGEIAVLQAQIAEGYQGGLLGSAQGELDALLLRLQGLADQYQVLEQQTLEAAAAQTQEFAAGMRTTADAAGGLTEQQALLLEQTADLAEETERLADAETRRTALLTAQTSAMEGAAKSLGTSLKEIRTGVSDMDREVLAAFQELAAKPELSGEPIARAYVAALKRISQEGVPALTELWTLARTEEQITQEQYEAGITQMMRAMDRFHDRLGQGTRDAAARARSGLSDMYAALDAEVDAAVTGMDRLIARQEILVQRAALLDQLRAGEISSAEMAERQAHLDEQRAELATKKAEAQEASADAAEREADATERTADASADATASTRDRAAASGDEADAGGADSGYGYGAGYDYASTLPAPSERSAAGGGASVALYPTLDIDRLRAQAAAMQPIEIPTRLRAVDDDELGLAAAAVGGR
jgi:hypothetical protein